MNECEHQLFVQSFHLRAFVNPRVCLRRTSHIRMHLRRKRSQQHCAHVVVGYWDGPYHLGTDPESVTKPHSPPSLSLSSALQERLSLG